MSRMIDKYYTVYSRIILVVVLFSSTFGFSQIYEATTIDEYRVIQYDTLNVEIVKEYLFSEKSKDLMSIKKYDSDGFIIEQADYGNGGNLSSMTPVISYSYNSDRTECIEVWISGVTMDTGFVSTATFALDGRILSKTETRRYLGAQMTIDYTYDHHRNCTSIETHGGRGLMNTVESFKNEYDSLGRIIRQVHTNESGIEEERLRSYNSAGQVERKSVDKEQSVVVLTYNEAGKVSSRHCKVDSSFLNFELIDFQMCVDGSEVFEYNQNGKLTSIHYECNDFINQHKVTFTYNGEEFEYNQRGLLYRHIISGSVYPDELGVSSSGYEFEYKFFQTKK